MAENDGFINFDSTSNTAAVSNLVYIYTSVFIIDSQISYYLML